MSSAAVLYKKKEEEQQLTPDLGTIVGVFNHVSRHSILFWFLFARAVCAQTVVVVVAVFLFFCQIFWLVMEMRT